MTAEQMFNELGFKKEIKDYIINNIRSNYIRYKVDQDDVEYYVDFDLCKNQIEIMPDYDDSVIFDVEMLKAIYKQCQELGWIEPTIKINKIEHYKWEE